MTFSCEPLTKHRHRATHLSIISIFPHTLSFDILYPSISIMCFQTIPVVSQPRSNITHRWQRNPANLRRLYIFYYTSFFLHGSLELSVSCQPNSSPLPRGAGWAAVLFRGGWHPDLSFWRFQHSSRKALCYRLSFSPSFILSETPYHY